MERRERLIEIIIAVKNMGSTVAGKEDKIADQIESLYKKEPIELDEKKLSDEMLNWDLEITLHADKSLSECIIQAYKEGRLFEEQE